jgi:hypothetical protein
MAKTARTALDTSGWDAAFAALEGPVRESLARTMGLTGAKELQEEAKINARQSYAETTWVYNEGGSSQSSPDPGTLADAIYAARNNKASTDHVFVYSVSWNNTKAWWGRLREFGYLMRYAVYKDDKGMWHTIKDHPLATPKPMPAHPFLAPAFDAKIGVLASVMIDKGRSALPRILAEHTNGRS